MFFEHLLRTPSRVEELLLLLVGMEILEKKKILGDEYKKKRARYLSMEMTVVQHE